MGVQGWTFLLVGLTFGLYIAVALMSRARSTGEFYIAGKHVSPIANGMATAADWMSAASFISMAGLIAFLGMDGSVYLMGWTGGYVLLALLIAPYLRKFGKFTVPDFVGDRYGSQTARIVAVICAIFISFTYIAGQMRGVGVVFSRFLEVDITVGVVIGMGLVFFYAVIGGMRGITYTQVAQYCVLIVAYTIPAFFLAFMITGNPIPQVALGSTDADGVGLLAKLDGMLQDLGFGAYTGYSKSMLNITCITAALMLGTAGLPHVIIRFFTVRRVRDARSSAGWALLFIAILYTTAPAIAVFARTNMLTTVPGVTYAEAPTWVHTWEDAGLIAWSDGVGYRETGIRCQREARRAWPAACHQRDSRFWQRTIYRPRHHGAGEPGDSRVAGLGGGLGGGGGAGRRTLDRRGSIDGDFQRSKPRPGEAGIPPRTHRAAGTRHCPHCRRRRSHLRRPAWHLAPGLCCSGCCVRFRTCCLVVLPRDSSWDLLEAVQRSRRHMWHALRHRGDGRLHHLLQVPRRLCR